MNYSDRKIIQSYQNINESFVDFDTYKTVLESCGYFTEAFYGKSPILKEAEKVLGQMVAQMKEKPLADYTNSPLNDKLQSLLEKQFGFRKVYIVWKRTANASPNAFSYFSSDIVFKGSSIVTIDKKKGYYDKSHSHVCVILASSTMVPLLDLSPSEYMAILLHEIGHNFDYSPYMLVRVAVTMISKVCQQLSDDARRNLQRSMYGLPQNHVTTAVNTTISLAPYTNPGKITIGEFTKLTEKIFDKLGILKSLARVISNTVSVVAKGAEMFLSPLVSLSLPAFILLSPLIHLTSTISRKSEIFADSFAVSYGYAPDLSSALSKLEGANLLKFRMSDPKAETGLIRIMKDIAMANRYVLSVFADGSGHGSMDTRIKGQINQIKAEIKSQAYPKEVEKELMNQLAETEKCYEAYLKIADSDARLAITGWVRNLLVQLFNGNTDFIVKLFPNIDIDNPGRLIKANLESVNDYDLVTEGTNWDLHKIRKEYIKPIKEKIALAKKAIKSDNAKEARKQLKDIKKNLQKIAEVIKAMDNNTVEIMIGNAVPVIATLISMIGGFLLFFHSFIYDSFDFTFKNVLTDYLGGMGLSTLTPSLISSLVNQKTSKYREDLHTSMDNGGWQAALYKTTNVNQAWLYGSVKDLITIVEKLEFQCDNLEKGRNKNVLKGLENINI